MIVRTRITTAPRFPEAAPRNDFEIAPLPESRAFWKRTFDVGVAGLCLAISLPIMLIVALLVKLTSKGPVFYKSRRVGLGGRDFTMLKFRSMYADADARLQELWALNDREGGVCFKMRKDPRVTPLGRFIRKYSLDELPQFLNVLSGECSIVGPRALHRHEVEMFSERAKRRLAVKPGLTCSWQISGRNNISFDQWMELDVNYVDRMSLRLDAEILMKTPMAVIRGTGAY
jgi:lipopolysaccharide/colanic/teichoic acid biosynthesis glycosyltransferase